MSEFFGARWSGFFFGKKTSFFASEFSWGKDTRFNPYMELKPSAHRRSWDGSGNYFNIIIMQYMIIIN